MTHALLYRPGRKWRVAVAFGAAALVHVAALGFAAIQQQEATADGPPGGPEITCDLSPTDDPPPTLEETSPPAISIPTEDSFPEQHSTPPPVQTHPTKPVALPRRESNGTPGVVSVSAARVFALNAPRPEYPYEARRSKITGEGIVGMTIDRATGNVTDVTMWKSTGSPYLDDAATAAFRRWRFKPGSVSKVQVPITFTLTGASY